MVTSRYKSTSGYAEADRTRQVEFSENVSDNEDIASQKSVKTVMLNEFLSQLPQKYQGHSFRPGLNSMHTMPI